MWIIYSSCFYCICCSLIFVFDVIFLIHGVYSCSHKIMAWSLYIFCRTSFALFLTSSIHYRPSMCGVIVDGFISGNGSGSGGGLSDITLITSTCLSSIYIFHLLEWVCSFLSFESVSKASDLVMWMIGAISLVE